jgi:hypothetical protein
MRFAENRLANVGSRDGRSRRYPRDDSKGYAWLVPEDIQACLVYARRIVANERIEQLLIEQLQKLGSRWGPRPRCIEHRRPESSACNT